MKQLLFLALVCLPILGFTQDHIEKKSALSPEEQHEQLSDILESYSFAIVPGVQRRAPGGNIIHGRFIVVIDSFGVIQLPNNDFLKSSFDLEARDVIEGQS